MKIPEGWKTSNVGTALLIVNNKRKPINAEERAAMWGQYPYYGPTKIQGWINEFNYNGKYAIIGEDGDHFLKYKTESMTQIASGKFNVNNHAHVISGTSKCEVDWFFYYFQNRSIAAFLTRQGAKRYKLNKAALERIPLLIPPLLEQKRLAKILSTWDRAINVVEGLIKNSQAQKTALMQQLLTGKKRLPGFDGEWEFIRLKSVLCEEKTRNKDNNIQKVLSVTNHSGFVLPEEQFSKRVASSDVTNYKIVKKGQFGYNPSRLNVGSFGRLDKHKIGILSPMYVVFSVNERILNSDYFYLWMSTHEANQRVLSNVQGSVRDSLGFDALCGFPFKLPPLDEQSAIAGLFSNSGGEIESLTQQLSHLKSEKSALMQQLLTGKRRVKIGKEAANA